MGDLAAGETPHEAVAESRDGAAESVPKIGEESPEMLTAEDLFDQAATGRIVTLWLLTPTISAIGSYLVFALAF